MILYVVRHGETNENKTKIMQGDMETVLNAEGISNCNMVYEKLKDIKFDLVVSSPRLRAKETAEIVAPKAKIVLDERLTSRHHGEFQGMSRLEINLKDYWNIRFNKQFDSAESVMDLYNRVISLINDLKKEYMDKTVMIVTHSGICRILYYYFNGIPDDGDLTEYESTNCSIERYEVK